MSRLPVCSPLWLPELCHYAEGPWLGASTCRPPDTGGALGRFADGWMAQSAHFALLIHEASWPFVPSTILKQPNLQG